MLVLSTLLRRSMGRRLLAYSLGVRHIQDCSRSVVLPLIRFRFSREPWSVFAFLSLIWWRPMLSVNLMPSISIFNRNYPCLYVNTQPPKKPGRLPRWACATACLGGDLALSYAALRVTG